MKYVCTKKCFYNRVYVVGEKAEFGEGEFVPKHFKPANKVKRTVKALDDEPRTFAEIQKQEAEQALAAVGHKPSKKSVNKVDEKKSDSGQTVDDLFS